MAEIKMDKNIVYSVPWTLTGEHFNLCHSYSVLMFVEVGKLCFQSDTPKYKHCNIFTFWLHTAIHPQGDERKAILKTFIINLHNGWNSNSSSTPPDKTSVFFYLSRFSSLFSIARRSNSLQANCWSFNSCLPRLCFVNGWRKWN